MIDRALIVRKPWINLILQGLKTWEMRSIATKVRGRIGLIEQGSGLIVGEVDLVDCMPPLPENPSKELRSKHWIGPLTNTSEAELLKKWRYPWVLENPTRYATPIPYQHPKGAVIWVKLNQEAA